MVFLFVAVAVSAILISEPMPETSEKPAKGWSSAPSKLTMKLKAP
jgi:hypothetical protein